MRQGSICIRVQVLSSRHFIPYDFHLTSLRTAIESFGNDSVWLVLEVQREKVVIWSWYGQESIVI